MINNISKNVIRIIDNKIMQSKSRYSSIRSGTDQFFQVSNFSYFKIKSISDIMKFGLGSNQVLPSPDEFGSVV